MLKNWLSRNFQRSCAIQVMKHVMIMTWHFVPVQSHIPLEHLYVEQQNYRQKNDLIEAISEALETDRRRGTSNPGVNTLVANVEVVDRLPPLAEVVITILVRYRYRKGVE